MNTKSILCHSLMAVILAGGSVYAESLPIHSDTGVPQTLVGQPARPLVMKFNFGKADLKVGKSAENDFAGLAGEMKTFPYAKLAIDGHTDATGPHSVNDRLSQQRAEVVKQHFVAIYGIDPARIEINAHGKRLPLAPNATRLGREQNRVAVARVYRMVAGTPHETPNL